MHEKLLYQAVSMLAKASHSLTERDLSQPWQWHAHREGVRFALIGTYHELRTLAVKCHQEHLRRRQTMTAVHQALTFHHATYRDFQAVLLGVPDDLLDQDPAPGEWSLRRIMAHIVYVECFFFTLVHDGLIHARTGAERPSLSNEHIAAIIPDYNNLETIIEQLTRAPLLTFYDKLHQRIWDQFNDMSDEDLLVPSPWWEEKPVTLGWRLHRFDAHLREHTIQIEKSLAALDVPLPEGRRQLRRVYGALADVASKTLGADDVCRSECSELAEAIQARTEEITAVLQQADRLVTAVQQNNLDQVQTILAEHPTLVDTRDPNQLPIALMAAYHQQRDVAQLLVDNGAHLDLFTAAAVGKLETVQELINSGYKALNDINLDGYNPLHLACFFNQEPTALRLIEQGADVNAVSQNKSRLRPVHAAAAGGNLAILSALLAAGADTNAQQEGGFTPLHAAAQTNNQAMTALLLTHGADPNIANAQGQIPHELSPNTLVD